MAHETIRSALYQIGALTVLLLYGIFALNFDVTVFRAVLLVGTAIATQAICSRIKHVAFDPRSAAISGLSLSCCCAVNRSRC